MLSTFYIQGFTLGSYRFILQVKNSGLSWRSRSYADLNPEDQVLPAELNHEGDNSPKREKRITGLIQSLQANVWKPGHIIWFKLQHLSSAILRLTHRWSALFKIMFWVVSNLGGGCFLITEMIMWAKSYWILIVDF